MASHARDSASQEPVEKSLVPLSVVAFREPTKIPGVAWMITTLEANETRVVDGKEWSPPAMWLDKALRAIRIGGATYPLERVHYLIQSPVAITKKPKSLDLEAYTLGAKPKK